MMCIKNNKGFTLLEMVIVIIILGILSTTAIPYYLNIQKEAKIAATKGKLAAIRGGIELAHAKIMASGVNTGPIGNNPDWPTLEEVQFNELRLSTRPKSILNLRFVRSDHYSTVRNEALPTCNLPDMTPGMSNRPSAVTGRTLGDIRTDSLRATNPRRANEGTCWAYYPGDERDENGRAVDALFYINDDRPYTDNIDAADLIPSQF